MSFGARIVEIKRTRFKVVEENRLKSVYHLNL